MLFEEVTADENVEPEVGSSRIKRLGPSASAGRATLWPACPCESVLILFLAGRSNPRDNLVNAHLIAGVRAIRGRMKAGGKPADLGHSHPVVKHGGLRDVAGSSANLEPLLRGIEPEHLEPAGIRPTRPSII